MEWNIFNTSTHSMVKNHWGRNVPFFATHTSHKKHVITSKWPIQTHPIRNLTTSKHLPTHMCFHLVMLWRNPPASATPLIENWPIQVILTYNHICWVLSTIIMILPYPSNLKKLQHLLSTCSSPRRPLFLHALSFQCTSKLCGTFLNQFSDYFHIKRMHNTI